jgi:hypothetical protein
MFEVHLTPAINRMSSNRPGNSFLKNSCMLPIKLLSQTSGPINLLLSKPQHSPKISSGKGYSCLMWTSVEPCTKIV